MPIISYPYNFLSGLSAFWQRFFADSNQLESLYEGSAVLMGQAYLDLLENVLAVCLKDVSIYHKEYFKLLTIREDQVHFEQGATLSNDRWLVPLLDNLVAFRSLDNQVFEPTTSLQLDNDFNLTSTDIRFKKDPSDPLQTGVPTIGFPQRALDIAVGGKFDDTTRPTATTWMSRNIYKGDTIRFLDPIISGTIQRKRADYPIVLVRADGLYVSEITPLTPTPGSGGTYAILRRPYNSAVSLEPLVFSPPTGVPAVATLANFRIDQGSVHVYAKRGYDGQDVIEDVDYTVNYEQGEILKISNPVANPLNLDWQITSPNKVDYTWQQEVWPTVGPTPRSASTGITRSIGGTTRVLQIAAWAPDAVIDLRTLAHNFGSLIGSDEASSEAYRALLRGIFQLYILGPVLERIESALNVILGFPVIRDDGEIFVAVDLLLSDVDRITTRRLSTNALVDYDFPKGTPLRPDILAALPETLTFVAFEPLTTALTVTDYIENPSWWHGTIIPAELFSLADDGGGGSVIPDIVRRVASPFLIPHVANPADGAQCGDIGLVCGADDEGVVPPPGNTIFRHRLAFLLMDRFFKFHTFSVRFSPAVLSGSLVGSKYTHSLDALNKLVRAAKPAHTYVFVTPITQFLDTALIAETQEYQPQRYIGADPNATELYPNVGALPNPIPPHVTLGLFLGMTLGSGSSGPDQVLFADPTATAGSNGWLAGDYFHYELGSDVVSFPVISTPVAISGAPVSPRYGRFVRVFVNSTIGGKALVENLDYTVDVSLRTVTRLTVWDITASITVTYVQLNVGNVINAPADPTISDMPLLTGNIDPATIRAAYDPAAVDWLGALIPVSNHRDLSFVERALTLKIT